MKEHEAEQLLDMLKDNYKMYLSDAAKDMWIGFLVDQDAEVTTKAVLRLVKTETKQPTVADLTEVILLFSPDRGLPPAGSACQTCGGDRFVLVQRVAPLRSQWLTDREKPQPGEPIVDQYAPCPDCNPEADTSFRRGADGTMVETIDPSRVREMMFR